ncbi:MAG TPA: hypothetical protein VJS44_09980 [Pyrinomonadaceae bacterium]|nr:hypothetical protein [Pyrinomonadaceae bacterium]
MRRHIAVLFLIALSFLTFGCRKKVTGIEYRLDPGTAVQGVKLGWHNIYFANRSGQDLHEVHLTVTVLGEDGTPVEEKKYYAAWLNGQTVEVSLSREKSPINVQKVSLSGTCDEGEIDYNWNHGGS